MSDPFDISKALEGAVKEQLSPAVSKFNLVSEHSPAGDQEKAIEDLVFQLQNNQERCVLLGVTGSGKTFAMAHLIERLNIPTLIMSHNKTLARQLYQEMAGLFPKNGVEYFVSHYDYYQPEAYLPKRDLYIDKELSINERIEQERFATVASLVSRPDCIVVSSVSCIYGLNAPETFLSYHCRIHVGQEIEPIDLVRELVELQYGRTSTDLERGQVRLRGENLDVWMPSRDDPLRIRFGFDGVEHIQICDPVSWEVLDELDEAWIHPKEFFMVSPERFENALENIETELDGRVAELKSEGKDLQAYRLEQRTQYDLEMLREVGHCTAVENYSMHFDGRKPGERPYCLLDFFSAAAKQFHGDPQKFLVIMDESHVTLPQVGGMYGGDKSRKLNLIEHGFRLPSAADNRPLKLHEFQGLVPQMVYVSATPGERELLHLCETTGQEIPLGLRHVSGGGGVNEPELSKKHQDAESMYDMLQMIEKIPRMEIRPTGLLDPTIEVRGTEGQVADLLSEINDRISKGERALVTVLTIKFAEEVSQYLNKMGIKAHYLHSEIDTIERTEIINALRIGHIDAIVGINLLREGLDIPEVSLVAIFDADRQGFLRNERSLLQTIGRAARNSNGKVILYADSMSPPMMASIKQTLERRDRQIAHNDKNNITPVTIQKALPKMGSDIDDLIAGTAGGKRLVASKGGRKGGDWASNLKVGAGRWAPSNSVTSNISQPIEELNYSIEELKTMMQQAALELDFERAAMLRDKIHELENS
ncbi:MAG: helicase-related protein [Candidatus Thermoplasmatota archaeon]|nr:excinuclease ABC subunit B [Euryarchaeota archaeon]MEE2984968.1 helicase-related protein [Candidatus Thermoplasmatota archaeon]|tara:strand:+ start:1709 stop:3994 length:2286 start_codon:yes stop_codon:yes gene_type:complete